ncbi:MAG: phosphodiester glycosidase family protein [Azospirillaceae bacterium]
MSTPILPRLLLAASVTWVGIAGGQAAAQVAVAGSELLIDRVDLRVERLELARGGGSGEIGMLTALIDPAAASLGVADRPLSAEMPPADRWEVRIDASFFDEFDRPIRLIRDRAVSLGSYRSDSSAVFWCVAGSCRITPSRQWDPATDADLAVQATPRLIADGAATQGVRNPDRLAARAGIAVLTDGRVLLFATDRGRDSALSFNEVRAWLQAGYPVSDAVMLDGGSSAILSVAFGPFWFENQGFRADVPLFLSFGGTL